MKALSVRQPWAWAIMHAGKDIENRNWRRGFRGRFLLHAAKGMTRDEYDDAAACINRICASRGISVPPRDQLERGGFIGSVELAASVLESTSPWFFGPCGFVLRDPKPMPFTPWKGELGFFDVTDPAVLEMANR